MMFGRSWQAQVADYLMISRKTVSSWIDRGAAPAWVDLEIKPLAERRAKEAQFGLESLSLDEDDFLHWKAILDGQVFYYDTDRYDFNDIEKLIENQKWTVADASKQFIRDGQSLDDVLRWAKDQMLSENDIADHLERNGVAAEEMDEIKNMRGDACLEVCSDIEIIFERFSR